MGSHLLDRDSAGVLPEPFVEESVGARPRSDSRPELSVADDWYGFEQGVDLYSLRVRHSREARIRTTAGRRFARRARTALVWGGMALVVVQLALSLAVERSPKIRYPQFGFKLELLNKRLAEYPQFPLVLLMGSSRTEVGMMPESFAFEAPEQPLLAFNFALSGAGPIQHLMLLKALLREGIRPEWLAVEVFPMLLNQCGADLREEHHMDAHRFGHGDLDVIAGYWKDPVRLQKDWWTWHLAPAYGYRHQLVDCWRPQWCAAGGQYGWYGGIRPLGWLPFPLVPANQDDYQRLLEHTRREYRTYQSVEFEVTEEPDRAMRTLLSLCRDNGIGVTLFLMPEGTQFADLYPPAARARVDNYLAKLRLEYDFELYDASGWLDDGDFADGHHLLPKVAEDFSRRFAREILRPSLKRERKDTDRRYALSQ